MCEAVTLTFIFQTIGVVFAITTIGVIFVRLNQRVK